MSKRSNLLIIITIFLVFIQGFCFSKSVSQEKTFSEFGGYFFLGRPETDRITVKIIPSDSGYMQIKYYEALTKEYLLTPEISAEKDIPVEVLLSGLKENTEYFYEILFKPENEDR